jgi:hypothetical protein
MDGDLQMLLNHRQHLTDRDIENWGQLEERLYACGVLAAFEQGDVVALKPGFQSKRLL